MTTDASWSSGDPFAPLRPNVPAYFPFSYACFSLVVLLQLIVALVACTNTHHQIAHDAVPKGPRNRRRAQASLRFASTPDTMYDLTHSRCPAYSYLVPIGNAQSFLNATYLSSSFPADCGLDFILALPTLPPFILAA